MISLIEALNFRCLRFIQQPMGPFHVLVGPNASGKTTFLDVVAFLSDLVSKPEGLEYAIGERTNDFRDLVWGREGDRFELTVEARIPEGRRHLLAVEDYDTVRYEVAIGVDPQSTEIGIVAERGWLKVSQQTPRQRQQTMFPWPEEPPDTIVTAHRQKKGRSLFAKAAGGNDNYYADAHPKEGRWAPSFKLGSRKSTLANLPEDEENFPVSTWFKQLLSKGVERIVLNSLLIRKASPPGQVRGFKPDGSNLPWVVAGLEDSNPARLKEWMAHVRTALPDLEDVRTVVRPDDRHRYLILVYRGGLEVPSWMASDGTLRLLALTLPAYLEDFRGIYLIEEPENGIHPRAVETMHQSLSSVYDAQILMATHSPVILSVVKPEDVLCFAKTAEGATDIVAGDRHPKLSDWQGEENLGVLFAGGVLG
jgi:predicted ATPase